MCTWVISPTVDEHRPKHVGNKPVGRKISDTSLEYWEGVDSSTVNVIETLLWVGYKHPMLAYHKIQLASSTENMFCC